MIVQQLRTVFARQSNRNILIVMLCADALTFSGGMLLERYSLIVAADKSSSALLILGLLAANFALFGVVLVAIAATSFLAGRVVQYFLHRPVTVIRGEVEAASVAESERLP